MSSAPIVPCRLFVIAAREAPICLIFRRGPSKWTQIIKWNTDSDTFEEGAWFHGRIYPERCDVSPDGTKLIYFAMGCGYRSSDDTFPSTWTAISKAPWLTALCVLPNCNDTYFGGGIFETDNRVWVNQNFHEREILFEGSQLPDDFDVSHDRQFWDHNWHTLFRLERSGWKPIEPYPWGSIPFFRLQDGTVSVEPTDGNSPLHVPGYIHTVHEKAGGTGSHSLFMNSIYSHAAPNSSTFELRDDELKIIVPIEGAIWADWDKRGRLVYAKEGKLFAAEINSSVELLSRELADFNSSKPKRTKSLQWAREW